MRERELSVTLRFICMPRLPGYLEVLDEGARTEHRLVSDPVEWASEEHVVAKCRVLSPGVLRHQTETLLEKISTDDHATGSPTHVGRDDRQQGTFS